MSACPRCGVELPPWDYDAGIFSPHPHPDSRCADLSAKRARRAEAELAKSAAREATDWAQADEMLIVLGWERTKLTSLGGVIKGSHFRIADLEAAHRATAAKLARVECRESDLVEIGARMATILYNVSQPAYDIDDRDREVMREWGKRWDEAARQRRKALDAEPGKEER